MPQYISIEQFWESPKFHCPACGAEIFSADGEPTESPCEHLLFSWINQVGEFFNAAEEMKAIIENDEQWSNPADKEFLERCPDNTVLFALDTVGMACGPWTLTVIHAIKFPEE